MALFLGVDVGTQGTKALVYSLADNAVLGRGSASYGLLDNGGCALKICLPSSDPNTPPRLLSSGVALPRPLISSHYALCAVLL